MTPTKHSEISQHRCGGLAEDYLPIHTFMDHTKSLCPDMRHRILHTNWAINQIIIPIFGHTIRNSDGTKVEVKDLCEKDHILPDYRNRFIPTIADFCSAIDDSPLGPYQTGINDFHKQHAQDKQVAALMLSPLAHTGMLKSLLFTHNSWFVNMIIPRIFDKAPVLDNFTIAPSAAFNAMTFELWMDNGSEHPPSAQKIITQVV